MHVALHYLGICMTVSPWDHACSTTLSGYLWLFQNEIMYVALHYLGICMNVSQWEDACSTTVSGYLWLFQNEIMYVALQYLGISMPVSQWDHACSTTLSGYLYACFTMRSCMQHYTIWVSVWLFHNEMMHVALQYLGISMPVSQWDHACSTTVSGHLYACFTMRACM